MDQETIKREALQHAFKTLEEAEGVKTDSWRSSLVDMALAWIRLSEAA